MSLTTDRYAIQPTEQHDASRDQVRRFVRSGHALAPKTVS
jgi:hypothetical protein